MPKYTIEDARALAISKGGKFISNSFRLVSDKYVFQCSKGHQWTTTFHVVNSLGCWCPKCAVEKSMGAGNKTCKYTIEDAKRVAIERGGLLLSTEYRSVSDILSWQCKENHVWQAAFRNVHKNTWCPTCAGCSTERLVRRMFEFIFKQPFIKARPEWLKSPLSNQKLELDGYNENLKIAFEYDGIHHYEEVQFNKSSLSDIQSRDVAKTALCIEKGIILIRIPYTIKQPNLYAYILSQLPSIPPDTPTSVPISTFEVVSKSEEKINDIRAWLAEKFPGAELLSRAYMSSRTELDFKCAAGHDIHRSWSDLCKGNHLCRSCGNIQKAQAIHLETISRINQYLASHGYHPLDQSTYNGSHKKMTVKCRHCQTDRSVTWANLQNYDKRMCCSD